MFRDGSEPDAAALNTFGVEFPPLVREFASTNYLSQSKKKDRGDRGVVRTCWHSKKKPGSDDCLVTFWDFSDMDVLSHADRLLLPTKAIYLLVFSMADMSDLSDLTHWIAQLHALTSVVKVPILLVGTHSDVRDESECHLIQTKIESMFGDRTRGCYLVSNKTGTGMKVLKRQIGKLATEKRKWLSPRLRTRQIPAMYWMLYHCVQEKVQALDLEGIAIMAMEMGADLTLLLDVIHSLQHTGFLSLSQVSASQNSNCIVVFDPLWMYEVVMALRSAASVVSVSHRAVVEKKALETIFPFMPAKMRLPTLSILENHQLIFELQTQNSSGRVGMRVNWMMKRCATAFVYLYFWLV